MDGGALGWVCCPEWAAELRAGLACEHRPAGWSAPEGAGQVLCPPPAAVRCGSLVQAAGWATPLETGLIWGALGCRASARSPDRDLAQLKIALSWARRGEEGAQAQDGVTEGGLQGRRWRHQQGLLQGAAGLKPSASAGSTTHRAPGSPHPAE